MSPLWVQAKTCQASEPLEAQLKGDARERSLRFSRKTKEATVGFEPTNNGFAIHRLSHLATSPETVAVSGADGEVPEE